MLGSFVVAACAKPPGNTQEIKTMAVDSSECDAESHGDMMHLLGYSSDFSKEDNDEGDSVVGNQPAPCNPLVLATEEIGLLIVSYLLYHGPAKWIPQRHFVAFGCSQSCGCCRFKVGEILGACEVCEMGYLISCVSRSMRSLTSNYGAIHKELQMHCSCNQCSEEWLNKGWICPDLCHWLEHEIIERDSPNHS